MAVPALLKNIDKAKISSLESDITSLKDTISSYYLDKSSMINSKNWLIISKDHNGNIKYYPDIPGETPEEIKYIKSEIESLSLLFGYYLIEFEGNNNLLTIEFDGNEFVKAPKIK